MAFIQLNRPMIFGSKHRDAGDVVETSQEVAAHMIGIGAASNAQLNETAPNLNLKLRSNLNLKKKEAH